MEKFKIKLKKTYQNVKYNIKKYIKELTIPFIMVLLAIFILIIPLLNNKISFGHDYKFHATNTIINYDSIDILKLKLTLPQIYGKNIANGLGYGTGIFYPSLTNYLASYITVILNLTYQNSVLSLTYLGILIIVASGLIMYKFTKRISNDKYVSAISAITYISYSYFLCNIYARNALGESLISIFLPLVLYGLYELFLGNEEKFIPLFVTGYVGMINSHLVISIFITIIIIIMFLFNLKKVSKKEKLKKLILASILILLMSGQYLVPLLEHRILGEYVVFEENVMYNITSIKQHTLNIFDYVLVKYKTGNGVEVYFGFITIISMIITIILNRKIFKNNEKKVFKNILLLTIISMILSSKIIPWNYVPQYLKMIQFPWRICGITSLGVSILSGYFIKLIEPKYKKTVSIFMILIIIFFGYATIPKENMQEIFHPAELSIGNQQEYLPVKTKNNLDYFENRNQEIIIKNGNAKIKTKENITPYLNTEIELMTEKVTIELPRLYYLGYKIILKEQNGNKNKIDYYENEYGFIELEINKSGILEVDYKGTIANRISNYICFITIAICVIKFIYNLHIKKKKD